MINVKSPLKLISISILIALIVSLGAADSGLDVSIATSSSQAPVQNYVDISGEVSGEDLNKMRVERKIGDDWVTTGAEQGCAGTTCNIEISFTRHTVGERIFRIKAFQNDGDSYISQQKTVKFYDPDEEKLVENVDISVSSREVEVPGTVTLTGDISGQSLNKARIERLSGDRWVTVGTEEGCAGTTCNIERTYSRYTPGEIDFRVKGFADDGSSRKSSRETVRFYDPDESEDSFFELDIIESNSPVKEGEDLEYTVKIHNTGDKEDTQNIEAEIQSLNFNKDIRTTLQGGSSTTEYFEIPTDSGDAGNHQFIVESENDYESAEAIVQEKTEKPANFNVEITGTNSPVNEGETLQVDYRIENTGEQKDTQDIGLWVDGVERDSEYPVTLEGGEEKTGTLSWNTGQGDGGDYEATVSSRDDSDTEIVTVNARDFEDPEARLDVRPDPAKVNEEVTFDASNSFGKDSADIDLYYYDFEDDGQWDVITSRSSESRSFGTEGSRTAAIMVEDTRGNTDTVTKDYTVEKEKKEDAFFEVSIEGTNSPVNEGETIQVDYTVENTGEQQDTQTVELARSGSTVDSETVTLNGGDSASGTLEWETGEGDSGPHTLRVSSDDSSDFTTVKVRKEKEPAEEGYFDVEIEDTNSPIDAGETLEIDYTVENTGEQQETQDIALSVDFSERDSRTVSLDPGEVHSGAFEWNTGRSDRGSHIAIVQSADDADSELVEVRRDGGRIPVAELDIDPDPADRYERVTFDASDSFARDGKDIDLYYYDFEDDGDWELVTTRDEVSRSFTSEGERTARVMVEDTGGRTDTVREDYTIERDGSRDDEKAELDVTVRNEEGDRLEDVRVRAENGERVTRYTDRRGETSFNLKAGRYDVEATEPGYFPDSTKVRLSEGEKESVHLELEERESDNRGDIRIRNLDFPSEVCRGESMKVSFDIVNDRNSLQNFQVSGRGLSSIAVRSNVMVGAGDSERTYLRFTNIRGSGEEDFTIRATNGETAEITRTVEVRDCLPDSDVGKADRITMNLDPQTVVAGQSVRVHGYVDGADGRKTVELSIDGRDAGRVTTEPDGYYQVFIRPGKVGSVSVTASTDSTRATRRLEVLPTSNVYNAKVKNKPVFQGETFQVCGDVESQVTPKVMLLKNGEVVDTKDDSGEVCFERKEFERGEVEYEIRAGARGQIDSASTRIEILETDVEARNFPDQVAQVRSGPGIVKVELYNNQKEMQRYDLRLGGLPDDWTDQSDKQVILRPGEREEAFFYLTPKKEGVRNAELTVEKDGTTIHEQDIEVRTGGTTEERGFFSILLQRLGFM